MSERQAKAKRRLRDYQVFGPLQQCIPGEVTDIGVFEYIRTHSVQEGTTGSWSEQGHKWVEEQIEKSKSIDVTASEIPKELEHHDHRD